MSAERMRERRPRRRGLQTELLFGLGLVMVTATGVMLAVGLRLHGIHLDQIHQLAARALLIEATTPGPLQGPPGSHWWQVRADGTATNRGDAPDIDDESRAFAALALERDLPLLQTGAPWEPLHFAAPQGAQGVAVMRLPAAAPPQLLVGLLVACIGIFTAFGATVLRGRVVSPLQRLATAVRAVAEGSLDARVPEGDVAETAEVARAFNDMAEALDARTRALEKAVADLRESNRSLRTARDGLDRAERLAAVGHLASGVAHEVGNPMGALLALLDLIRRDDSLSPESRSYLEKALGQGERVRSILRELLDFSRPARGEPTRVELGELAEGTLELVRAQRRYASVSFGVQVDPAAPEAWADRAAVSQLLLNLVLNGADAVRERGGRVDVQVLPAAARVRAGEDPEAVVAARTRHDAVELRVVDDGPGIPQAERERIFDPFFTTKNPGEGTGLGLSNALRMAEQLGGRLDLLEPGPAGGAVFAVQLPAAGSEDAVPVPGVRVQPAQGPGTPG